MIEDFSSIDFRFVVNTGANQSRRKMRNGGIFDGQFIIKPQNLQAKQHFYR
jgi:hypothetical protein